MRYQGGKYRHAKKLADVMLASTTDRTLYMEPFVGGGSVAAKMGHHFRAVRYSDAHLDLMVMWGNLLHGWDPPEHVTREQYEALRHADPSPERGFAGFAASFGGKWFGGYAGLYAHSEGGTRSHVAESRRSVLRKLAGMKGTEETRFAELDFRLVDPAAGAVVYCDPPYSGTLEYAAAGDFPTAEFWSTAQRWAEGGAHVFVSERIAPEGWTPVWTAPVYNRTAKTTAERSFVTESLFTWKEATR